MESAIEMNNSYIDCTNALNRIGLFSEASHKEYEINLKEIALKVLKENGTEEDFDFLATEAAKDHLKRIKKSISKSSENVTKFNTKIKDSLVKLVSQDKHKNAMAKADEACKANSKLSSKKIEYNDTDKQVNVLTKNLDNIRKRVSKVKAKGVATEDDIKFIQDIDSELTKSVDAAATTGKISFGDAIDKISAINSKSEIDSLIPDDMSDLDFNIDESNAQTPETAEFFDRAIQVMAKIKKEISSKKLAKYTSMMNSTTTFIKSLKGSTEVATESETKLEDLEMFAYVVESVEEEVEETVEVVEESAESEDSMCEGLDLDAYFNKVCEEVFESAEEVEVEADEDMAQTYMEQMEAELFGESDNVVEESSEEDEDTIDADTYLEQMEAELFGEDEDVVEESSDETTEEDPDSIQSLLDEMEKLL